MKGNRVIFMNKEGTEYENTEIHVSSLHQQGEIQYLEAVIISDIGKNGEVNQIYKGGG